MIEGIKSNSNLPMFHGQDEREGIKKFTIEYIQKGGDKKANKNKKLDTVGSEKDYEEHQSGFEDK